MNGTITVNDELDRMWKEVVVICFKTLSQLLPAGTEENYEKLQSG